MYVLLECTSSVVIFCHAFVFIPYVLDRTSVGQVGLCVYDKSARAAVIVRVTTQHNPSLERPWCCLFMLAKCILANPPRGGRSHWRDTLKLVQTRIQRWKEGDLLGLWTEASSSIKGLRSRSARAKSKPPSCESLRRSNASRARRAAEDGQYKKALQSLTSMGLAPPSPEVFNEMLAKHPQSDPPRISDMPPPAVYISPEDVINALKLFPTGSAPGPSGLRANHLKEAVFCSSPHHSHLALQSLTSFVNLLCAGKAPQVIIPHFCVASLLPCMKKDGGLRPIAVGEVLRRLVSKCATRAVLSDTLSILPPLQVGVGLSGGCDAVLHSVLSVIHDTNIPSENKFVLLVDFSNAFNSIDRATLFKEVRYRLPQIAAWTECSYGSQPILLLNDCPIYSCCGVQQGDPLGPLGFALVLQPVTEKIKEEVPSLLINVWYLDDGTLCGTEEELAIALSIIETEGPSRGLFLNREKSLIYTPMNSSIVHPKLRDIPSTSVGFSLLGSPIGPSSFCEETVARRIHKVQEMVARLHDLEDSQLETTLLRSCLALPKVSHTLRTCPPCLIPKALDAFDDLMRGALSDLAGSPVPNWSWLKASLPSSLGGLNLRSASRHAPAAYIGSLHQCQALVTKIRGKFVPPPTLLAISLQSLSRAAGQPDWISIQEIDVPLQQHSLSRKIDEATFDFCSPLPVSLTKKRSCYLLQFITLGTGLT